MDKRDYLIYPDDQSTGNRSYPAEVVVIPNYASEGCHPSIISS